MSKVMDMTLVAFTDGGSRGNPGNAACAAWFPQYRLSLGRFLGTKTNNEAEYEGLITALHHAVVGLKSKTLKVYSDSELMVKQIRGEYTVKNERLRDLWATCMSYIDGLDKFEIHHIRRNANMSADLEVNRVLDKEAENARAAA